MDPTPEMSKKDVMPPPREGIELPAMPEGEMTVEDAHQAVEKLQKEYREKAKADASSFVKSTEEMVSEKKVGAPLTGAEKAEAEKLNEKAVAAAEKFQKETGKKSGGTPEGTSEREEEMSVPKEIKKKVGLSKNTLERGLGKPLDLSQLELGGNIERWQKLADGLDGIRKEWYKDRDPAFKKGAKFEKLITELFASFEKRAEKSQKEMAEQMASGGRGAKPKEVKKEMPPEVQAAAKKEVAAFEALPPDQKKEVKRGLLDLGYRVNELKAEKLKEVLLAVAGKAEKGGFMNRWLTARADRYGKDADMARTSMEKSTKLGKLGKVGQIASWGRVVFDIAGRGAGTLNPFRHVTAASMFFGREAEIAKETRLKSEDVLEKTRIKDADEAAEEAWGIFYKTQGRNALAGKGDRWPTADELKKAYTEQLPKDLLKRLENAKDAGTSIVSKIFERDIAGLAARIDKKMDAIDKKSISFEEKSAEKAKLMAKHEEFFRDADRMVGQAAGVDVIGYGSRLAQRTANFAKIGMIGETVLQFAGRAPEMLAGIMEKIGSHPGGGVAAAVAERLAEKSSQGTGVGIGERPHIRLTSDELKPGPIGGVETEAKMAEAALEKREFDLSTVKKGDGFTQVMERQLQDPAIRQKFGLEIPKGMDPHKWAMREAAKIARENGLLDKKKEQWIKFEPGKESHVVLIKVDGKLVPRLENVTQETHTFETPATLPKEGGEIKNYREVLQSPKGPEGANWREAVQQQALKEGFMTGPEQEIKFHEVEGSAKEVFALQTKLDAMGEQDSPETAELIKQIRENKHSIEQLAGDKNVFSPKVLEKWLLDPRMAPVERMKSLRDLVRDGGEYKHTGLRFVKGDGNSVIMQGPGFPAKKVDFGNIDNVSKLLALQDKHGTKLEPAGFFDARVKLLGLIHGDALVDKYYEGLGADESFAKQLAALNKGVAAMLRSEYSTSTPDGYTIKKILGSMETDPEKIFDKQVEINLKLRSIFDNETELSKLEAAGQGATEKAAALKELIANGKKDVTQGLGGKDIFK